MRDIALQKAIDAMGQRNGNLAALAEKLGITTQALSQWRRVPPTRVLEVERITGISRNALRPDIYPVDGTVNHSDLHRESAA
jgi:DNA-binding transcriptional regulator YdaS (Cro superfamily)